MSNQTDNLQKQPPDSVQNKSLVPPFLAAILSALLPGLGQILAKSYRRGALLLFSMATLVGLLIWRFRLAAPRDEGVVDIFLKGLRLKPFLVFVLILVVVLYIWIIIDAYAVAKQRDTVTVGLLFMVLVVFFSLGWQIGEINPVALFTQADDAGPALMRVLWPWEKAIEYPEEIVSVWADVQVPCADSPPPPSEPSDSEAYLIVSPTCGSLSEQDGTQGSILTLQGYNLIPNTMAEIIWEDPNLATFRQRQEGEYVQVMPDETGAFEVDIIMPYRLLPPSVEEEVLIWRISAQQVSSVGDPQASQELKLAVEKITETIFIGMMATFFGVILAIPVSFIAARNLMSANRVTIGIYYVTRGILNIIRSIEPLIWAIIFVIVVGLGPFAGILALTVHSIAALGKLYSESIESIDPGPIEAIQATGANWVQVVVFAVVPQIIPPFVSFTIYRWDINIRMSTIIGFVGGGGIGFLLAQWIRLLDYRSAGIAVWFIAITVAILDYVSAEIRARFV
ncbi:phosphonate ABC transporter, permease protein PhnE [Candidatus Leptofilum sp.]|uniref:phosphonate ABC transporter, permease protein PhnE n=1 Tax=Candidatus Leptofilum sp. TaxID=3241576 RepID=UPI003B5A9FFA